MSKISLVLLGLVFALQVQARKPAFVYLRTAALLSSQREIKGNGDTCRLQGKQGITALPMRARISFNADPLASASRGFGATLGSGRDSVVDARIPRFKKFRLPYDVKRESGAYLFDTVYKLRIPAKIITVSVNAGYTFYNSYVHGRRPNGGNNSGIIGGLSLMHINGGGKGSCRNGLNKKGSFLRLSADIMSNPAAKGMTLDGKKMSLIENYSHDLSARIYLDGRITRGNKNGAFSTYYLIGIGTGAEQMSGSTPFIVGLGLGYRLI
jgi:hypothetical protein